MIRAALGSPPLPCVAPAARPCAHGCRNRVVLGNAERHPVGEDPQRCSSLRFVRATDGRTAAGGQPTLWGRWLQERGAQGDVRKARGCTVAARSTPRAARATPSCTPTMAPTPFDSTSGQGGRLEGRHRALGAFPARPPVSPAHLGSAGKLTMNPERTEMAKERLLRAAASSSAPGNMAACGASVWRAGCPPVLAGCRPIFAAPQASAALAFSDIA